jgi:DNA-binding PadR family transcriptional regulator
MHRRAEYCAAVADDGFSGFGRYAGPATFLLASLAGGPKHGYALTKDVEEFAGVRLAPGTLYEALTRLEQGGFIEALPAQDRRKPYRLTAAGAEALKAHLDHQRHVANIGLRRLRTGFGAT